MQGMFYGAFQGRKRDIHALLSKLGEARDQYDIKGIIFCDVELPDNWEEMDEKEWVKIQFASHGSMSTGYLEYGLFSDLGAYMLYVEGFTCTISMNYGNYRTYTYSPYGSLEILSPDTKKEAQKISQEFEKETGCQSVTRDKQDWDDSHNGNAERFIANEVLPPATVELQDDTDQVTPKTLEVLVEQDDVESFARLEASAPELWDWLPSLLHCAHICGAVKMEAHLNELEQAGLAAGKKRKPLTVAQWKKLWALSDNKDGTYTVTKYKGPFSHAILPEMVGKRKVVEIDLYEGECIKTLTIPASVTNINYLIRHKNLKRIEVSENNQKYSMHDRILFNKAGETLLWCPPDYKGNLGSFSIPEGVTKIGDYAFEHCSSLTSITIPKGTEIGESAFSGCTNLTSISIPESVTEISESAFSGCTNLTSISIPESVTEIGDCAFSGCSGLTNITIPTSVTKIGRCAFYYCDRLRSITIPESVTEIGESAFSGCTNLTSISIPKGTKIVDKAFSGCCRLTSISIPKDTEIGYKAFSRCTSLKNVTISESGTVIGYSAFSECSHLTNITIPKGTIMGWIGFSGCSRLKSITLPEGITEISSKAFSGCRSLESITIPKGVTKIDSQAFNGCSSLESITIPESVTKIGWGAFYDCSRLKSITLPEGITEIGSQAFYGCSRLETITIPKSVSKIDRMTFLNLDKLTIHTPAGSYAESFAKKHNIPYVDD